MPAIANQGTRVKKKMTAAVLLLLALLGGGWAWTPDKDRAALEAAYAGPASEFATVGGVRLHVRDSMPKAPPDTPTLVFLHGFGASLHTWEPWAQALSANYRVIRLDLPGAGLTGPDPLGDYSDERFNGLLTALLEQRGVAHATLVGHSMGGRLAWRYTVAQPRRVDRLVLVAPDGFASPGFEYGKPPAVSPLVRVMRWALPRAVVRMSLEPAYADKSRLSEETLTRYHDLLLAPGVRGAMITRMEQLVLQDPAPLLKGLATQTLLLWGEQDTLIPVSHAQDYLKLLHNARLAIVPGVGHLPQEEAPEASLALVRAFLQQ